MKEAIVKPVKGIDLNKSFEDQTENTYRYALNAVVEEDNGELNALSTERGNVFKFDLDNGDIEDAGYVLIGSEYIDNENTVLFFANEISGKDLILLCENELSQNTILINEKLNFSPNNKIDSVYRLRKGCERTIYFTDGLNPPRVINIDSIEDYYPNGTFDVNKLNLLQSSDNKSSSTIEVIDGGTLEAGSYNIALQYVDNDFNSLEFYYVSDTINIYNDSTYKQHENIEGSSNKSTFYQEVNRTSKALQIKTESLDTSYNYYRLAIIKAVSGLGTITEVLYSDIIPTSQQTYIYSDDTKLFEGSLQEIQQFSNYIAKAKHIETVDNILLLANTEGPDVNWGLLQKYASKIVTNAVVTHETINNIDQYSSKKPNIHNEKTTYQFGEIYSFGIVYVFEKGFTSPVYHIPGKSPFSTTNMGLDNQISVVYNSKGDCQDYWGLDYEGNPLEGENVRHHRIPTRRKLLVEVFNRQINPNYQVTSPFVSIEFSNIEIPSIFEINEKIIGYYIVQAKREDSDKTILDSAILVPTIKNDSKNYVAHHVLNNKKTAVENYHSRIFAMINPGFKFLNRKYSNFELKHEGYYNIISSDLDNNTIQDVQPGSSYNPERHKQRDRDSDGFSLHTLTRNNILEYDREPNTPLNLEIDDVFYLDCLNSYNIDGETLFNLSSDNKTAFIKLSSDFNHKTFPSDRKYPYVLLTTPLVNQYADFESRAYYRSHSKMKVAFNNQIVSTIVTRGDSYVNPMSYSSTVFNDVIVDETRRLKKGVIDFILGAVALLGGVAGLIFSIGLSTPVSLAAISFGISQLSAGFSKANAARVYQDLHEEGLKDTIIDNDVQNNFYIDPANPPAWFEDDEIQWFMDTLSEVYFESDLNIGLRLGANRVDVDFLPEVYSSISINRNHLINKLTTVDQDRDEGRAYLGFAKAEIYDINLDFQRREYEKMYFSLSSVYDFCGDCQEKFPHRIWKSNQSFDEESFDNYRIFLPNNYKDISGEGGEITDLFTMQSNIYIATEKILWHQPQTFQERVTSDIISFIGTGEYFSVPARKIIDSDSGYSAGINIGDKWATVKSPYGVFFLSRKEGKYYTFNGSNINSSTDKSMYFRFQENLKDNKFIAVYDKQFERILLTAINNFTLSYSFKMDNWVSFHSYKPYFYFTTRNKLYSFIGDDYSTITSGWQHNVKGTYINYYNQNEDFVIDLIAIASPLQSVTWEDITVFSEAEKYNTQTQGKEGYVFKKIFFNNVEFYTKNQYSGNLDIVLKEIENIFNSSIINYPKVESSFVEGTWRINNIRDYINDKDDVLVIDNGIEPSLNTLNVNYNKNWEEIELIRDKYLGIRLRFNTFTDVKLTLNYLKVNFTPSIK